jgi:SAM-dependent methyltransferase
LRALPGLARAKLSAWLSELRRAVRRAFEQLAWGGRTRERLLVWLLGRHYESLFWRQWVFPQSAEKLPHYMDHRIGAFGLAVRDGGADPYTRGFLAAEALRAGDRVLDIGCGDGFFDRGFFSHRCGHIDAIDIEPSAIGHARRYNAAPNIAYLELDAVAEPFPSDGYDVIIWDGAIGHFAADTTSTMLAKIGSALKPGGVFVGSESLGAEGHDHLQFFADLEDLRATLRSQFEHVEVRSLSYEIGTPAPRREAYWRCAAAPERLRALAWLGETGEA